MSGRPCGVTSASSLSSCRTTTPCQANPPPGLTPLGCHMTVSRDQVMVVTSRGGRGRSVFTLTKRACFLDRNCLLTRAASTLISALVEISLHKVLIDSSKKKELSRQRKISLTKNFPKRLNLLMGDWSETSFCTGCSMSRMSDFSEDLLIDYFSGFEKGVK